MSWCWSYPFFDTLYYYFPAWYFYNYYYYPVYTTYPYGPIYYGSAKNAPKPASLNHKTKNEQVNINKIVNQVMKTLEPLVNSDDELNAFIREIEEMNLFQDNYDHDLLSLEEMAIVCKGKEKLMADNKNNVDTDADFFIDARNSQNNVDTAGDYADFFIDVRNSQNNVQLPPMEAARNYLSESGRNNNDLFARVAQEDNYSHPYLNL